MDGDKIPKGGMRLGELIVISSSIKDPSIWDVLTEEEVYPEYKISLPYDAHVPFLRNRSNHIELIKNCGIKASHASYIGGASDALRWRIRCSRKKLNWLILNTGATVHKL